MPAADKVSEWLTGRLLSVHGADNLPASLYLPTHPGLS